jgi:Ca-activated chloride channel family protein
MTCRTTLAWSLLLCPLALAAPAWAEAPIKLEARLAQPVMQTGAQDGAKPGTARKNYLRVGLEGCKPEPSQTRTPVNVAFVIDRSGSMEGERIAQARAAAAMAVSRLDARDIASIVIFDHTVEVLVPARPVADPALFVAAISQIGVRGDTAIHAGVLTGAAEVARFKDPGRLNRVVLLSDGQANVGPSKPADFAALGSALLGQGISVSTVGLGLGYNEDLMATLARAGDGNHAFAREPTDLVQIFNKEFDDVLASCAQTVSIDIDLQPGVRAVRALSREGKVEPAKAQFQLNQVYAATEHYVLLEVEVDDRQPAGEEQLGLVKVTYTEPKSGAQKKLDAPIRGSFSASAQEASASRDPKVAEAVVEQSVRARTQRAILLQDAGKHAEVPGLLLENAAEIEALSAFMAPSTRLRELQKDYYMLGTQTGAVSASGLSTGRKLMRSLDAGKPGAAVRY